MRPRPEQRITLLSLSLGLPLLLVAAPLPFAGRTPAASAVLCAVAAWLAACALLELISARARSSHSHPIPAAVPLCAILLLATLQLIPLPARVLEAVSPTAAQVHNEVLLGEAAGAVPISLAPGATLAAIGRLSAALAIFIAAAVLARRHGGARLIALGLCGGGTIQALYGLVDFVAGHHRIFAYAREAYIGRLAGTYINPNHFAGLMELALPATLGLILSLDVASGQVGTAWRRGLRGRIAQALSDPTRGRQRLLAIAAGLMAIAVICTRSRAGIALTGTGCVATLLIAGRAARAVSHSPASGGGALSGRSSGRWTGGLLASVIIATVALSPLAYDQARRLAGQYRSAPTDLLAPGGRLEVWGQTHQMARDHPLLGVGLGGFAPTFPRYRGPRVALQWQEAHNDFIQLVAELGVSGAVIALMALAVGIAALKRSLVWPGRPAATPSGPPGPDLPLRVALACGCGALLLHETIDFNLQIPANALAFAAAAAACLVPADPRTPRPVESGGSRRPDRAGIVLAALAAAGSALGVLYSTSGAGREVHIAREMMVAADEAAAGMSPEAEEESENPAPMARRASAALRRAIALDPARAEAHLLLARLERRGAWLGLDGQTSFEKTGERLSLAARLDPYRPDLRLGLLRERVARGERAAALRELRALAVRGGEVLRRGLPIVWSRLRDAERIGRAVDAGHRLARGGAHAPETDSAIILADFLLRAGQTRQAEERLRRMLEEAPEARAAAFTRLARLLRGRGETAEAIRLGGELLERGELSPIGNAEVRCALARSLITAGDLDTALHHAAEASALSPTSPGIRRAAAEVYLAAGRPDRAAREYEFLLWGGAPVWYYRSQEKPLRVGLARAYDRMHRRDAALREWREVARLDPEHPEALERMRALSHGM
jgi:O-antigen ligase/tetratricopeptide (TPR) repeat protein